MPGISFISPQHISRRDMLLITRPNAIPPPPFPRSPTPFVAFKFLPFSPLSGCFHLAITPEPCYATHAHIQSENRFTTASAATAAGEKAVRVHHQNVCVCLFFVCAIVWCFPLLPHICVGMCARVKCFLLFSLFLVVFVLPSLSPFSHEHSPVSGHNYALVFIFTLDVCTAPRIFSEYIICRLLTRMCR